jgi:hypothetical protein
VVHLQRPPHVRLGAVVVYAQAHSRESTTT